MQTRQPSPDWQVLLEPFQSLFTKPGFRYFCVFVRVLAHLDGRLWVTQVVLSGLLCRHWTNFYRFLRSSAWSVQAVTQQMFWLCLPVCQDSARRVFVAVDDTVCGKRGTHFESVGVHYDPMNQDSQRHLSRGHCWVCLALLSPQTLQKAVALFVGCALYIPQKACGETDAYQSKLQLAARLVAALPVVSALIAVADGAFAKKPFVQALKADGRFVLSRLRKDAVFYDVPPARVPGQKGASRKYGDKHKATDWATGQDDWQPACLWLYGRQRQLRLKSRVVLLRRLGVQARLVAVRFATGKTVFLFCTETTLSAEQIVCAYAARFAIETGFRDAKQSFGLSSYQVRNRTGYTRLLHLCLWAQTLLRLRCWYQRPTQEYGGWRKRLPYLTLAQQKRYSQSQEAFFAASGDGATEAQTAQKRAMTMQCAAA
jgi:hypothetical protein